MTSPSYSEVITFLYEHTTFSFYDPISFFIFIGSILPHRWTSIRHVHLNLRGFQPVVATNVPGEPPIAGPWFIIRQLNFDLDSDYFVYYSQIHLRNNQTLLNDLFSMTRNRKTSWDFLCLVLQGMYGLKTLRVTVCKSRFSLKGDAAEDMIFVPIDDALGERRDSVRVEAEMEWARTRAPPGQRLGTFLSLFGVCA